MKMSWRKFSFVTQSASCLRSETRSARLLVAQIVGTIVKLTSLNCSFPCNRRLPTAYRRTTGQKVSSTRVCGACSGAELGLSSASAVVLTNRPIVLLTAKWKATRRTIRFVSQLVTTMAEQGCAHLRRLVARSRLKSGRDWRRLAFAIVGAAVATLLLALPGHVSAAART